MTRAMAPTMDDAMRTPLEPGPVHRPRLKHGERGPLDGPKSAPSEHMFPLVFSYLTGSDR